MAGGGVGSTEGSHAAVCCHMHENVLLCVRGECAPWNAAETHGGRLCARLAAQVQVPSDSALGEAVDVVTPGKNQGLTVPRRFCGGRWGSASPSGPSLGNCFSLDPAHSVGPRAGLGVGVGPSACSSLSFPPKMMTFPVQSSCLRGDGQQGPARPTVDRGCLEDTGSAGKGRGHSKNPRLGSPGLRGRAHMQHTSSHPPRSPHPDGEPQKCACPLQ